MCIEKGSFDLLIDIKKTKCPSLKNIVLFDIITEEQRIAAQAAGLNLYLYSEVLQIGK